MATTMATSLACIDSAGANANSTIVSNALTIERWINQAESFVNNATRINYSDTYATLNTDVKQTLSEVCECLVANRIINYDMSGFSSRIEAETMMDVNLDTALRGISVLRDKKSTTFITNA